MPGGENRNETPLQAASRELRKAIEDKAEADVVQQKLAAYRQARVEAKKALETAQSGLRELVTARQEAVLVSMGTLE